MARTINYVQQIGVELEGGWDCTCGNACGSGGSWPEDCSRCSDPDCHCHNEHDCYRESSDTGELPACVRRRLFTGADVHHDGSVDTGGDFEGEIACGPFSVTSNWDRKLSSIWPTRVNESCGMHVHISFLSDDIYARFMTPAFEGFLLGGLHKWGQACGIKSSHTFWKRLAGVNTYCQRGFCGDKQANYNGKHEDRYRVCNYTWKLRGTVEIRVLPMFDSAETSMDAIREVISLANQWARKSRMRFRRASTLLTDEALGGIESHERHDTDTIDLDAPMVPAAVRHITEDLYSCA